MKDLIASNNAVRNRDPTAANSDVKSGWMHICWDTENKDTKRINNKVLDIEI